MKWQVSIMGIFLFIASCSNNKNEKQAVPTAALSISAEDNRSIINREISTWQFAKIKNLQGLQQILADDYLAYFGRNVMNKADVLRTFQSSTVRNYRLSNIVVKPVDNQVAIIYYNLQQDVVDGNGDAWTPEVASSAVYAKRNGEWKSVFYQETPVLN